MNVNQEQQIRSGISWASRLTDVNRVGYAHGMTETMYVRFGQAPESGRSANAETEGVEAGVSCYRAEWQSSGRDIICITVADEASAMTSQLLMQDRPLYLIEGERLDVLGGDREPLLTNITACIPLDGVEHITYCVDDEDDFEDEA